MQLQDGSLKMRLKATVLTFWPQLKSLYFESPAALVVQFGGVRNNCTFTMMICNTQLRIIGVNIMALLDY